jgi:DNA mismatch repair protein MutL
MSETDARMAFERHATSKIRNIDDLFRIKTMGSGESFGQYCGCGTGRIKDQRKEDETGTYIEMENSLVTIRNLLPAIQVPALP